MYLIAVFILCLFSNAGSVQTSIAEQVHISFAETPVDIIVTWVTQEKQVISQVYYGATKLSHSVQAEQTTFEDGGKARRQIYIHRAKLLNLVANTTYEYCISHETSRSICSPVYNFKTLPRGTDWPLSLAILGDLGVENAVSLPHLLADASQGMYHAILHNGDFAYDMHDNDGHLADTFMNMIQPIAATVPYMTTVGNHEAAYNFSHYKKRFTMPGGDGENLFYSFDIGPLHVIGFSSEVYYYTWYGWEQIMRQYQWIEKDLQKANEKENRMKRPWIIALCHRPMYCSNSDDDEHCNNRENTIRDGIPFTYYEHTTHLFGLEELFYKYGVDIIFGAHEHSYERMWPVYKFQVCNGTGSSAYASPRAPVHIISGSAGCKEEEDPFDPTGHPWSAFRSDDYGYTRLKIFNGTHLQLEQLSVEKAATVEVLDTMLLSKSSDSPYPKFSCPPNSNPQFKRVPGYRGSLMSSLFDMDYFYDYVH